MQGVKKIAILCWLLASSTVVAAESEKSAVQSEESIVQKYYQCERELNLPVSYINTHAGGSFVVVQAEGRQIPMNRVSSSSGERYVSVSEKERYSWHTKGELGVLSWISSTKDAPEEEQGLLKDCKEVAN